MRTFFAALLMGGLQAASVSAYVWDTQTIVFRDEGKGVISEYSAGYTDTVSIFETVVLIDCSSRDYQGYTARHAVDLESIEAGHDFERGDWQALQDALRTLREDGGGVSFAALAHLASTRDWETKYGEGNYADEFLLELSCLRLGNHHTGWTKK